MPNSVEPDLGLHCHLVMLMLLYGGGLIYLVYWAGIVCVWFKVASDKGRKCL